MILTQARESEKRITNLCGYEGGRASKSGNIALFEGKLIVGFNTLALGKRFALGTVARKGIGPAFSKSLAKASIISRRTLISFQAPKPLREDRRQEPEAVPALPDRISERLAKRVDKYLAREFRKVDTALRTPKAAKWSAEKITEATLDIALQALGEALVIDIRVWEPTIVVETHPDGRLTQARAATRTRS